MRFNLSVRGFPLLKRIPLGTKSIYWVSTEDILSPEEKVEGLVQTLSHLQDSWKGMDVKVRPWKTIVLHHTKRPTLRDAFKSTPPRRFAEEIDNVHRITKGVYGLGYHFLIEADGAIAVSLRWQRQLPGAHIKRKDDLMIGVGIVGDFDQEHMRTDQYISLVALLTYLNATLFLVLSPSTLLYCRDIIEGTTSPGSLFLDSERSKLINLVHEPKALSIILNEKRVGAGGMILQ